MNLGRSKKAIFSSFIFINFFQPSISADFFKINNEKDKSIFQKNSETILMNEHSSDSLLDNYSKKIFLKKKFFKKNSELLLADLNKRQEEIVIQSDKQYEKNDVVYAEGNVSVFYKEKLLKADNLIYDKLNKKVTAEGNISLILGDQFFKASDLEYNFISEKGYLLNVSGSINTDTLMEDLSSNFRLLDFNKIESLLTLKKNEVLNTPGKVINWLFFTDKLTIDGKKWKSKKAFFSNDLLEAKQAKLQINSLRVISDAEKLSFKSSLNYLILEEKVSIPFWLGERTLNKNSEGSFNFDNRWNLGYDYLDKDGYFLGRKFNPIDLSFDFVLDLEPQFLVQRSFNGYTNSFVEKNEAITSERVKRNANFEDYFALESQITGRINNWDLEINKNLNSFDFDKFSDAFRFKTKFSKEINFLDSKWQKSFYGVYRDRVWNGSLGEAEIYYGYGSQLKKENTWVVNGINKTEILSLGLAKITAEGLNTKNLLTNLKGSLFYSLNQNFPISIEEPKNKSIDISYRYIPEPITKGLSLNTRLEGAYSFYENGKHQEYLGLGIGPKLVLGNLKKRTFDYTRLSFFPFYRINSGKSAFKFDQNYDNLTLDISFDQQLFGPLILKTNGTLNLTNDSDDYGEFIDSKIALNWKRRSYEFGIFYQPSKQAGGISFGLFGFK